MKKKACLLVLVCLASLVLAAGAYAQAVAPVMPETLRCLVAGKTFTACLEGYGSDQKMENVTLFFRLCEQERYRADEVEALAVGSVLLVGGDEFVIREISRDEFGYELTGESYTIWLFQDDEGTYYAVTDTENRFYADVAGIQAPAWSGLRFLDWSNPEAEAPLELTLQDLLTRYDNNDIHSMAENTEITFDEEGRLTEILYRYTPWN